MSCSPKWDVNDAITPPARSQRLPPVDGRASDLTRVGSSEFHRPSKRNISVCASARFQSIRSRAAVLSVPRSPRSEEHTSELQSRLHLVCRLLLEKKKKNEAHLSRSHTNDFRY